MADQLDDKRPDRDRRRRPRASVVCDGEYVVLDRGMASGSAPCSLLDASLDGATLAVVTGELHRGQRLLLRLESDLGPAHAPIDLQAVVMNHRRHSDPKVYGIAFPGLSPLEKKQLLRIMITSYRQTESSAR